MIKYFVQLFFVLILGFIFWGVYQRQQWPIDYGTFTAAHIDIPPFDPTFEQHINKQYFINSTVITDKENLRFPEDIAVSNDGTIYTVLHDGRIAAINSTGHIEHIYQIENSGIGLGVIITSDDSTLYFLTENRGLVKFQIASKTATYLFHEFQGRKLVALNNLCLDEVNQILYITDSTPIHMKYSIKEVLLKHKMGRIFSFDLKTNQAQVLLKDIAFPNGIVYEQSTRSVIFSELTLHRIIRLFVNGQRKGQTQTILDNFFGYADNLKLNDAGQLLIGVPSVRDNSLQPLYSKPDIRKWLIYAPEKVLNMLGRKMAGGVRVNTRTREITQYMFGGAVKTFFVTTILQKNGKRYFASLRSPTVIVQDIGNEGSGASQGQKVGEL